MSKLKNVMSLIKRNFPSEIQLPTMAESILTINKEAFISKINNSIDIWGSGLVGGYSYFGKNEDISKIHSQMQNYLLKKTKDKNNDQFYMLWSIGDYSLLNLYENYDSEIIMPYPKNKNVLCVSFGVWIGSESLFQVLHEQKNITDIDHWSFGEQLVNLKNNKQASLLKKMQETILLIDKNQSTNN